MFDDLEEFLYVKHRETLKVRKALLFVTYSSFSSLVQKIQHANSDGTSLLSERKMELRDWEE